MLTEEAAERPFLFVFTNYRRSIQRKTAVFYMLEKKRLH